MVSMARLSQIKALYGLHDQLSLKLPSTSHRQHLIHPSYPFFLLSSPRDLQQPLPPNFRSILLATLSTCFNVDKKIIGKLIPPTTPVDQYGRIQRLEGGDTIQAHDLVTHSSDNRDMSFVRFQLEVDIYAHLPRKDPVFELHDFFGKVLRSFVINIPELKTPQHKIMPETIVYAVIRELTITRNIKQPVRLCYFEDDTGGKIHVVDLKQILHVIGRIFDRKEWVVVDRSTSTVPVHMK